MQCEMVKSVLNDKNTDRQTNIHTIRQTDKQTDNSCVSQHLCPYAYMCTCRGMLINLLVNNFHMSAGSLFNGSQIWKTGPAGPLFNRTKILCNTGRHIYNVGIYTGGSTQPCIRHVCYLRTGPLWLKWHLYHIMITNGIRDGVVVQDKRCHAQC